MRTIFCFCFFLAGVSDTWAEIFVDFRNNQLNFTIVADRKVYDVDGITPLIGTNFLAQLYYNVGADMNDSRTMISVTNPPVTFRAPGTMLPGTWTGGGSRLLLAVPRPTYNQPSWATLQVRVWDVSLGNTWGAAELALMQGLPGKYGMSAPFNYEVPYGTDLRYYMEDLRSFSLVPEPGSISLGILSGIFLLLFQLRRRRSKKERIYSS